MHQRSVNFHLFQGHSGSKSLHNSCNKQENNKQENTEGTETSSIILSNMKVGRGRQCVTKSSCSCFQSKKVGILRRSG